MPLKYHTPKSSLAGRLLAFAAWFILIAFILAGAVYGTLLDSVLLGILGALVGILPFCLLQSLAAKAEERQEVRRVVMRSKTHRPSEKQEQTEPIKPVEVRSANHESQKSDTMTGGEKDMQSKKELLVRRCMKYLCENLPKEMPSTGKCSPLYVGFDFPGTHNKAYLCVQCDAADPSLRRLVTRIVKSGTDLCMMNYMECGTRDEIIAYLSDQTHATPLLDSLQHLSDRMDDRD